MKNQKGEQLKNFVTFQRQIKKDVGNGKLTPNEFLLYCWLRLGADVYGTATTHITTLRKEIFPYVTTDNYINQLLLSLRSKRYIFYERRQGRRGSFEVQFGNWILPTKEIKQLDRYFAQKVLRSKTPPLEELQTEVPQNLAASSQTLELQKNEEIKEFVEYPREPAVRGHYNDTDKDKDIDNNESLFKKSSKGIAVIDFVPQSYEEERCKEILSTLGDESMDYILSRLKKFGFFPIERTWGLYQDARNAPNSDIRNPPAYFNSLLEKVIKGEI